MTTMVLVDNDFKAPTCCVLREFKSASSCFLFRNLIDCRYLQLEHLQYHITPKHSICFLSCFAIATCSLPTEDYVPSDWRDMVLLGLLYKLCTLYCGFMAAVQYQHFFPLKYHCITKACLHTETPMRMFFYSHYEFHCIQSKTANLPYDPELCHHCVTTFKVYLQ